MKIVKLSILNLFLFTTLLSSQSVNQEWARTFISGEHNAFRKLLIDPFGNIYAIGESGTNDQGTGIDWLTTKYTNFGELLWQKKQNGSANGLDWAVDMAIDKSNDIIVIGSLLEGPNQYEGRQVLGVVKYNPNGDTLWTKKFTLNSEHHTIVGAISIDYLNNIYITGGGYESSQYESTYFTIKYNSNGEFLWINKMKYLTNTQYKGAAGFSIALDSKGNIYTTGYVPYNNENSISIEDELLTYHRTIIQKINPQGDTLWTRLYSIEDVFYSFPIKLVIDKNDEVYIGGWGETTIGLGFNDLFVSKYDAQGNFLWDYSYGGIIPLLYDKVEDMKIDTENNLVVTGYAGGDFNNFVDAVTIKFNPRGKVLWLNHYDGGLKNSGDAARSLVLDDSNNVYITGGTLTSVPEGPNIFIIKYGSNGIMKWIKNYNYMGNSNDEAFSIGIDDNYNIFVAGYADYGRIACILKYSQFTTKINQNSEFPGDFKLYQNYPNPFNPSTKFKIEVSKTVFVEVPVYDITGRVLAYIIKNKLHSGEYILEFNAEELKVESGVYFYSLVIDGNVIDTKKLVFIK